jgi:serine/threonine protein kinase
MKVASSTVRSLDNATVTDSVASRDNTSLRRTIETEWQEKGEVDLVWALHRHPRIARDRSLLLNLAVQEFRERRKRHDISDLIDYCTRFREFGDSIELTIRRQLEAQRFVDDNLELSRLIPNPQWPNVGEAFGKFFVLEEMGCGSSGRVYRCLERDVGNREVVVKATPLLGVEASILGRLDHPNIVPILSTGTVKEHELHYLCMPFRGRSTLCDLLDIAFEKGSPARADCRSVAATRWSWHEGTPQRLGKKWFNTKTYIDSVLSLSLQIADALEFAHRRQILHGDLKPSNVLLTPNEHALLLDFNLSQDYASSLRRCGGTLPYMPPEYLRLIAQRSELDLDNGFDARTDIFSFGALLYELLTGRTPVSPADPPDDASTAAEFLLDQHRKGVRLIRSQNSLVSRRLESLVLRCLSYEVSDRPSCMAEIKREILADMGWPKTLTRRARVRPLLFSSLMVLLACSIAGPITYAVTRPPAHVVAYQRALAALPKGDLRQVVTHLDDALKSDPTFDAALAYRGRTYQRLGELDLALNDFGKLARNGDSISMAHVAYCFNLKQLAVAAIPWYERAIENGAASSGLFNNLGASYLVAQTHVTRTEQLERAERYLRKALEMNGSSYTVHLNLVRLATNRFNQNPSHDPFTAWKNAEYILNSDKKRSPLTHHHMRLWRQAVQKHDMRRRGRALVDDDEIIAARLRLDAALRAMFDPLPNGEPGIPNSELGQAGAYFLEPFPVDTTWL